MIGSAVLAESRSWTSDPAVEDKKVSGSGEKREGQPGLWGAEVRRGRNAALGAEGDVFRGGKGREMKKQRDPGRKVP